MTRDLAPLAPDLGPAQRHRVVPRRHLAADRAVHLLVLEEQHRVVVADRGPEQALGVVGRRRDDDLEARDVGEERLDRLRVVQRAVDAAAVRRADHHRHAEPVVRAVAHPRRLGHDLVERRVDEVRELDLGDRPQAVHRGADRRADDHRLGQRRVDDPVVAELGPQPVGGEEHAALLADVLAQDDDRLVAAHLLGHALADRLDERPDRHQCDSAAEPWVWRLRGWPAAAGCHGGGASLGHGLRVHVVDGRERVRIGLGLGVVGRVLDDAR